MIEDQDHETTYVVALTLDLVPTLIKKTCTSCKIIGRHCHKLN